jgi:uncharacterized membrane protein YhaH (DUF805 family)
VIYCGKIEKGLSMNYVKEYFITIIEKKYAKFRGRATRKEFWNFLLLVILFDLMILGIGEEIKTNLIISQNSWTFITAMEILLGLFTLLPLIAIGTRRLHDIGKSGWWSLILLIPFLGVLILLVLLLLPSEDRVNRYGQTHNKQYRSIYTILKNA